MLGILHRLAPLSLLLTVLGSAQPGLAQIEIAPLAAPDVFSIGLTPEAQDPGFWTATSPVLAKSSLRRLVGSRLSPAGQQLAVRALGTGAPAPVGLEADLDAAADRAEILMQLGEFEGVSALLQRSPGVSESARLSTIAADAALLANDIDGACRIERRLMTSRTAAYWLKLRSLCQFHSNETSAAQLTYDLAIRSAPTDVAYKSLMGAVLGQIQAPVASANSALELALSRQLSLPIETALLRSPPGFRGPRAPPPDRQINLPDLNTLLNELASAKPDRKIALRDMIAMQMALGTEPSPDQRAVLDGLAFGTTRIPSGRQLALAAAASSGARGEVALQVLTADAGSGNAGLSVMDRVLIVQALNKAGLVREALSYAVPAQ